MTWQCGTMLYRERSQKPTRLPCENHKTTRSPTPQHQNSCAPHKARHNRSTGPGCALAIAWQKTRSIVLDTTHKTGLVLSTHFVLDSPAQRRQKRANWTSEVVAQVRAIEARGLVRARGLAGHPVQTRGSRGGFPDREGMIARSVEGRSPEIIERHLCAILPSRNGWQFLVEKNYGQ